MKKLFRRLFWLSLVGFLIVWGVLGVKILNGDYEILPHVYAGAALWAVTLGSTLGWKLCGSKCPHCGKLPLTGGEYCPYCGHKR